jgi:hypothetical protein
MDGTHCLQIFGKNKEEDEGENEAQRPIACQRKDKENGSGNPGMGELFFDSQSQKQDAGIRRISQDQITDRNMETMEDAQDETDTLNKVRHPGTKGVRVEQ